MMEYYKVPGLLYGNFIKHKWIHATSRHSIKWDNYSFKARFWHRLFKKGPQDQPITRDSTKGWSCLLILIFSSISLYSQIKLQLIKFQSNDHIVNMALLLPRAVALFLRIVFQFWFNVGVYHRINLKTKYQVSCIPKKIIIIKLQNIQDTAVIVLTSISKTEPIGFQLIIKLI